MNINRCISLFYGFLMICLSGCVQQSASAVPASTKPTAKADSNSLNGQVIVGYQGWFACPDDPGPFPGWGHWAGANQSPAIDVVPDTSDMPQQPGCRAPFIHDSRDQPVMLYSDQNPESVDVQFKSMQEYGVSGVALQRFVSELPNRNFKALRDRVLANVQLAAEHHGRVFFLTYDISGAHSDWAEILKRDWETLVAAHVTDSPAYLHYKGRPVVEVWGIGFGDRPAHAPVAMELMQYFTANPNSRLRASVMAGVPGTWRDMTVRDPGAPSWMDVYKLADSVSPWLVGMFTDAASHSALIDNRIRGDVALTKAQGQVYMPVVFPGFSSYNQSHQTQRFEVRARSCGQFLTMQTASLLHLGVTSFYVAMFDEANEGTAVFKARLEPFSSPTSGGARFLDATPGCADEGSLYMRLLGDLSHRI